MEESEQIAALQYQVAMMKKSSDGEIWYYRFDKYFEQSNIAALLRFDPRNRQWYGYDLGVYKPIEIEEIYTTINEWALLVNEKLTNQKISLLVNRMRAQCLFKGTWDPDPNIDNCLNGLVDKETRTLLPHTPNHMSLEQIPRHYYESEGIIPQQFYDLIQVITDQGEREQFIQQMVNIVHKQFDDELFMVLYGPKGGGKSTLLQLFEHLFGKDNVSKTPLQKIGKRFGLKELYTKRLNVNPDLPIVPMDDNTIALLKQLTGNDGYIEVELKGTNSFKWPVRCFLIFGINQLMGFKATSEKEIESIFRRAMLIQLPKTLERNTALKKAMVDPSFLDELYSWLVWMRPRKIVEDASIEDWVNIQKEKWLTNANPILTICRELYRYEEYMELPVRQIVDEIREELGEVGLTSQQLQTNVSQALQTMRIYRDNGRGVNAKYLNIVKKEGGA